MLWTDPAGSPPGNPSSLPGLWTIITGLVGLVSTAIPLLFNWIRDRDARLRRSKDLEDALEIAAFWESWLKSAQAVGLTEDDVHTARARADLLYISEHVQTIVAEHKGAKKTPKELSGFALRRQQMPAWRRWLLIYNPPRKRSWVPRILFYLLLGNVIIYPFVLCYSTYTVVSYYSAQRQVAQSDFNVAAATPPAADSFVEDTIRRARLATDQEIIDRENHAIADWYRELFTYTAVTYVFSIFLVCCFRWLALRLETPANGSPELKPASPFPAPLEPPL